MSSSSNDRGLGSLTGDEATERRLAAALAASFAVHAALVGGLEFLPGGMRWGDWSAGGPVGAPVSLRVGFRTEAHEAPPAPEPSAIDASASRSPAPAADPPPAPGDAPAGAAERPAFAPLPALRYYRTRDLDVRPGILVRVEPEFPEAAARRFLSGRVVAQLLIDESGAVERVEVIEAEPPGYFEAAARKAFLAARFTPGMKDGRPVRVQMLLELNFDSPPPPAGGGVIPAAPVPGAG